MDLQFVAEERHSILGVVEVEHHTVEEAEAVHTWAAVRRLAVEEEEDALHTRLAREA
jgi:hypothetical protein